MPDSLRTNTLTILGAVGYCLTLAFAALKVLGWPISIQLIALIGLLSASAFGVDFSFDPLPFQVSTRQPNEEDNETE